jgi:hypothetical protein
MYQAARPLLKRTEPVLLDLTMATTIAHYSHVKQSANVSFQMHESSLVLSPKGFLLSAMIVWKEYVRALGGPAFIV